MRVKVADLTAKRTATAHRRTPRKWQSTIPCGIGPVDHPGAPPQYGIMMVVPPVQSPREIDELLAGHLVGRSIRQLQVLGVNSLKTVTPHPDVLVGAEVRSAHCEDRIITISTAAHKVRMDLQRTGRVAWLRDAAAWQASSRAPLPSVRLLLDDGTGLDLTEPAKTKRISVSVSLLSGPA